MAVSILDQRCSLLDASDTSDLGGSGGEVDGVGESKEKVLLAQEAILLSFGKFDMLLFFISVSNT
jgi:hypothetical protein